jgi:hypothetical protein
MSDLAGAKALAKQQLANIDGVIGFGTETDAVRVYVRDKAVAAGLPETVGGFRLRAIVTGNVRALAKTG